MKRIALILLATTLSFCSFSQELDPSKNYTVAALGFYNVENLFDTINERGRQDADFSPTGNLAWNEAKYQQKLGNLSKVIGEVGTDVTPDGLALLGLSEVENKAVLEDLVLQEEIKDRQYKIVHYEGHDHRGIDCALIYQEKYFKYISSKSIELVFPDTAYHSRDQLLVTGELLGERIHVIVAHWPSRSGGQKRSEPRRIVAAELGRHIVDSILVAEPNAKILYMGDLNDDPENFSVAEVFKSTSRAKKYKEAYFYNPMLTLSRKGIGSLAWRDSWNIFDQILLSPAFVASDFDSWTTYRTKVYNKPYLTSKSGKYKGYPYRGYAGGVWAGGFSDHFPVYTILVREME